MMSPGRILRGLAVAVSFCVAVVDAGPSETAPRFAHVEKAGSGPPVLILVPCLGCDWRSWDEFMARNRSRYTMYAVTWPGMGDTHLPDVPPDPVGTPLWQYLLDATEDLLAREAGRAILVGHSASGPLVVQLGHQYPDRVAGLITVDATITNWDTFGFTKEERVRWADAEMREVLRQYDNDDGWRRLNAAPTTFPDPARARFYGEMWMRPPRQNVLRYWSEWLRADAGALISSLKVPLLAMYAISPQDTDPEKTKRELLARFERAPAPPHVKVEFVENSGHFIWEYQPERFDRLVAEFVDRIAEAEGQ
jgi:pimeloyl-ACP methyl ester carboxylesterase